MQDLGGIITQLKGGLYDELVNLQKTGQWGNPGVDETLHDVTERSLVDQVWLQLIRGRLEIDPRADTAKVTGASNIHKSATDQSLLYVVQFRK